MILFKTVLSTFFLFASLGGVRTDEGMSHPTRNSSSSSVCFRALDARTNKSIPDVRVSGVGAVEITLGTTDKAGKVCIDDSQITQNDFRLLLFCKSEFYYCGALRLSEANPRMANDYIDLAPIVIRDFVTGPET